ATASMSIPRSDHAAAKGWGFNTSFVIVAGGTTLEVDAGMVFTSTTTSVEAYDPLNKRWTTLPPMGVGRRLHTLIGPIGTTQTLLVTGGSLRLPDGGEEYLVDSELYSGIAHQWVDAGSMAFPRAGHTATLLASGEVL